MTPKEAADAFSRDVSPATFSADGASLDRCGSRVLVHQYKDRSGFLWLLMQGDIMDDPLDSVVRQGGKEQSYAEAVNCAVKAFLSTIKQ